MQLIKYWSMLPCLCYHWNTVHCGCCMHSLCFAQLDHYNIVNSFQQGRPWHVGTGMLLATESITQLGSRCRGLANVEQIIIYV